MFPRRNTQVLLSSRPGGIPQAEHFKLVSTPVPELQPGELLVRNDFLSVDPAMRGWANGAANYSEPVLIGTPMRSFTTGVVIASRHPGYAEGDSVMGLLGWQAYTVTDGREIRRKLTDADLPASLSLGVLGLNGITAYFALTEIGQARPGDTLVVSSAAGAVGSAVGQIAKLAGCRVVGITGGPAKVTQCIREFGFDAAVDYKSDDFKFELSIAARDGVDVYFDNTAGAISDAVLRRINRCARIVICGTASIANWAEWPSGPRVERHLLNKAARMQGFLIWDYEHRADEALHKLTAWVRSGQLRYREHILDGIEEAPGAIAKLYRGENNGKLLIRLRHEP